MSRVLIIGNGFDIYHGLPTRYNDFLFFAEHWQDFYKAYNGSIATGNKDEPISVRLDNGKLSMESLEDYAAHKYIFEEAHIRYLNDHLGSNAWINYFLSFKLRGNGWIDFETEIYNVLQAIDAFFSRLPQIAETKQRVSTF